MVETTRKVQGSTLTLTRAAGGAAIPLGTVYNASRTPGAVNKIPIGDWADTVIRTRPGDREANDWTLGIRYNPDSAAHTALEACVLSSEICTFVLVQSEGTKKTRTWTACVEVYGFSGAKKDIYNGQLTLGGVTPEVRS